MVNTTQGRVGKSSAWKSVRRLIFIATVLYGGACLTLIAFEKKLVFHPVGPEDWVPPPSGVQEVYFDDENGAKIHGWWMEKPNVNGAVLYCHGNAGNLSWRGESIQKWSDELNTSVFIFDYPGFGKSTGQPSEEGCYASTRAAWKWLTETKQMPAEKILVYGKSLGGPMAVEIARQHPHRALILAKTFTSLPDVGADHYPFFPVRWLAQMRFEVLPRIHECKSPIFLFHSKKDEVIPYRHSVRINEAIAVSHEFLLVESGTHNDRLPAGFWPRLREFLDRHARN